MRSAIAHPILQRVEYSNWISTLSAPSHGPLADTKLIGLIYVNSYKKMHSGPGTPALALFAQLIYIYFRIASAV